ncbi:hypothetical protein KAI87_15975, partial [Myxococcota bacterium]|nr:hypothetical protein [Myxococcota bacterium]
LSRGDPVSRAVFNLASDRVTIHEYAITVSASGESASKTASRTMPEKIQTYRITSAHVIVVTVANIYIFPRATWSAATALAVIPLDYYAHQLLVRNGYVYFGARQGNRISVLDAGNPRAPKQVGSFSLTRPLIRMASDGNRIYVLQGECSEANGKRNSGCDAIPDLLTYTTTRHDKYVATSFTTATAASPTLVATKALSHTHIDDLVPVNNQIYLYSHGDGYGAGSDAHFIRVRGQSHDELPGTFIAETAFDEPQRQQGDLAVSGQYVFIWTDRHLEAYRTDSATVATNVGQSLTCGAGLCVDAIYDMQVVGDYLYIFDYFHSFMVFDISGVLDGSNDGGYSGTENILQVGGWGGVTSYGGLVSGAYAYVISSTGLILLDISDPTAPVEVTTIDVSAIDLAVEGGVLYVSTEDAGLQIYELSRPSAFRTGIRYQEASGVVGQFDIGREHLFATQGDQIISWKIATTSSEVDPFVMLTSGLDMPYNGTLRVFDDKLWVSGQSGWNGACGGSETCLQIYDASYINETAMASRLRELNNPATKTNPFNTDGADCSSDVDCCGWQYCSWDSDLSKNVCKTGSVPIIRKVVKGPGTEYFALVRGSDGGQDRMGQPNDGIYTFSWDDQYSDPVRRTTTTDDGILAGHDGACNLTNPDATGIYDILWKDGVLYIAGSYLSATRATRWSDDEFLQWTGDTWSVNKTRGDGDNLCAHQLAASGSLLYVLGDTSDSTSCIEDWRLTRTGSTVSYTSRTLWVFDISDPMNPVQISQTDLPHQVDSMAVSGNWGYFPEERSGETIIMDIFDPTAPVPYGAYQTTGINSSVMVYGPDVFVNGENTGIRSIDGR